MKEKGRYFVKKIDVNTAKIEILLQSSEHIDEYVSDLQGQIIVFSVSTSANGIANAVSPQNIASGYRIPFEGLSQTWPQKKLFVTRRLQQGWTAPKPIVIESPFSHQRLSSLKPLDGSLFMSLSPNGKELLVQYIDTASKLPENWLKSPFVQYLQRINSMQGQSLLVLYHLDSEITTVPIETPFMTSIPLWSLDSRYFVVFAKPPVGSEWEKHEAEGGPAVIQHGQNGDLFWVQPGDTKVEMVASHEQAPTAWAPPLKWEKDDTLLVSAWDGIVRRFSHIGDHWVQGQSVKIPVDGFSYIVSDGKYLVGDRQSATTPPELFIQKLGEPKVDVFAKLNPQFDALSLASVKSVSWETSGGGKLDGTLFLPPDYKEGNKYPLVIQTKPYYNNNFACDSGDGHFPSFVPQPLADAGIAYLGIAVPDAVENYYPKGYPGDVAEAAFYTDAFDTAVTALSDRGIIDKNKVGIIGFSRSGWYTEFALTHGKTKYLAATVADNIEYSFSERAMGSLIGFDSKSVDTMYGGPPNGSSLKNWLDYSISFNIDKIHTPLLMEQMGDGALFDRRNSPPMKISKQFEVFTGLNLEHKPVELYYYPNEYHEPDDPQARLGTLQRNFDWYRFWLQGYERPNPEDPGQYKRWEGLRMLQDAEDKSGSQPTTAKPN
jgi:dipeptidyl aminopeptidase/acylaminoacyl peptidase